MLPTHVVERQLREHLDALYARAVDRGLLAARHRDVERFTLDKLKPKLRAELDRRLLASAELIKLNREEAVAATLRRFAGWATLIPKGGAPVDRIPLKRDVRKALAQLPFVERRVAIDQGHKLVASLSDVIAVDGGALAARWHSHWRRPGYAYRQEHRDRDGLVYAVRSSWAIERRLMTRGAGYTDELDRPAEKPFCSCYFEYLHSLRALPADMLTTKGRAELDRVRVA